MKLEVNNEYSAPSPPPRYTTPPPPIRLSPNVQIVLKKINNHIVIEEFRIFTNHGFPEFLYNFHKTTNYS